MNKDSIGNGDNLNTKNRETWIDVINKEHSLLIDCIKILQRLEREGVDLTVNDIQTIWEVKSFLGYKHPVSIEEGTGALI